ncbi:MAG TPA: DMT family transporter [Candidatus Baltobacteraceae bacterium]|nr:DMT family transporter [Candidatus Baltobacteraceae bacterium]
MVAGGAGVYLVAGFNTARPPIAGHEILGCALAVAGAIAIGAYFLIIREIRDTLGTRQIVTQTYSWAAIALIVAAIAARQPPPAFSNLGAWSGILAMALISQLLGHTAMNAALRWFSASAVAFTTLVEPLVAAALAYLVFREGITSAAIAGGVLILGAIAVFLREEETSNRRVQTSL